MKKGDRRSRYGGTNAERAAGSGWLNWHFGRGHIDFTMNNRTIAGYMRSRSWRRTL